MSASEIYAARRQPTESCNRWLSSKAWATVSRRGYNLTHRARKVREQDFYDFDLIVVMDDSNYENVARLAPERKYLNKVYRFVEFSKSYPEWSYVPDPYYEGHEGFELVLDLLEDGCSELLNQINKGLI